MADRVSRFVFNLRWPIAALLMLVGTLTVANAFDAPWERLAVVIALVGYFGFVWEKASADDDQEWRKTRALENELWFYKKQDVSNLSGDEKERLNAEREAKKWWDDREEQRIAETRGMNSPPDSRK